jgi:macrolide-specific efflux system membrane fusion protein
MRTAEINSSRKEVIAMFRCSNRGPIGLRAIVPVLGLLLLIPAIVMVAGCAKQSSEATAGIRDIIAYLPADGTIVAPASARADVYSPYTVPVAKVNATVGKSVRRGDVLLVFSAPQNEAYLDQARAALAAAKKARDVARSQFDQDLKAAQKQLALSRSAEKQAATADEVTDTGVSVGRQADEQAVIDAQARMAEAMVPYEQDVVAAQEQFEAAKAGSKAAQVTSPITGTVLAVNVTVGTAPDPEHKKPLVTVVNLEALKVASGVEEDQLSMLKPKNPAIVTIKEVPNVEFTGSLDEIYSEKAGFLLGKKYVALTDFRNTGGQAKPGMEATASIKVGEVHDVLAVPANAVFEVEKQHAVKLRDGQEWVQRIVEIGLSDGKYTEIKSGIKEGDIVMTNP